MSGSRTTKASIISSRALKPGARPLPDDPQAFISPVDGTVSQFGRVTDGRLIQAKGHNYSIHDLLPEDAAVDDFLGGEFCTIYLAPYNYHRIDRKSTRLNSSH